MHRNSSERKLIPREMDASVELPAGASCPENEPDEMLPVPLSFQRL